MVLRTGARAGGDTAPALSGEFSSADTILSPKATLELLKRHRLMVENVKSANLLELLR